MTSDNIVQTWVGAMILATCVAWLIWTDAPYCKHTLLTLCWCYLLVCLCMWCASRLSRWPLLRPGYVWERRPQAETSKLLHWSDQSLYQSLHRWTQGHVRHTLTQTRSCCGGNTAILVTENCPSAVELWDTVTWRMWPLGPRPSKTVSHVQWSLN